MHSRPSGLTWFFPGRYRKVQWSFIVFIACTIGDRINFQKNYMLCKKTQLHLKQCKRGKNVKNRVFCNYMHNISAPWWPGHYVSLPFQGSITRYTSNMHATHYLLFYNAPENKDTSEQDRHKVKWLIFAGTLELNINAYLSYLGFIKGTFHLYFNLFFQEIFLLRPIFVIDAIRFTLSEVLIWFLITFLVNDAEDYWFN